MKPPTPNSLDNDPMDPQPDIDVEGDLANDPWDGWMPTMDGPEMMPWDDSNNDDYDE